MGIGRTCFGDVGRRRKSRDFTSSGWSGALLEWFWCVLENDNLCRLDPHFPHHYSRIKLPFHHVPLHHHPCIFEAPNSMVSRLPSRLEEECRRSLHEIRSCFGVVLH